MGVSFTKRWMNLEAWWSQLGREELGELSLQGTPERTSIASSLRVFAAGGGSGLFFKIRAAMLREKTSGGRYPRVAGCDSDILEYRVRRAGVQITRERSASQRTGTLLSVVQERRHKLWTQMLEVGAFVDKKSRWLLFFFKYQSKKTKQNKTLLIYFHDNKTPESPQTAYIAKWPLSSAMALPEMHFWLPGMTKVNI